MAHISEKDLIEVLDNANEKINKELPYHHWKKPDVHYKILYIGLTEWNDEPAVIYKSMETNFVWVRPLEGTDGWLTPIDGNKDPRRFIPVSK